MNINLPPYAAQSLRDQFLWVSEALRCAATDHMDEVMEDDTLITIVIYLCKSLRNQPTQGLRLRKRKGGG